MLNDVAKELFLKYPKSSLFEAEEKEVKTEKEVTEKEVKAEKTEKTPKPKVEAKEDNTKVTVKENQVDTEEDTAVEKQAEDQEK